MKHFGENGKVTDRRVLASNGGSYIGLKGKLVSSTLKRLRRTSTGAKGYQPERSWASLTPGASVRIARELQGLTQGELAQAAGLTQATISGIERGRVILGVERAKRLSVALGVHPAVLLFPNWEAEQAAVRAELKKAS